MNPTKALDSQLDLLRFIRSDTGQWVIDRFMAAYAKSHGETFTERQTNGTFLNVDHALAVESFGEELDKSIAHGETFYVSPAMTDMVEQFAEVMPEEPLHLSDLFSQAAFVMFDRDIPYTIGNPDTPEGPDGVINMSIRALSWTVSEMTVRKRGLDGATDREIRPGITFVAWLSTEQNSLSQVRATIPDAGNAGQLDLIAARTPLLPVEFTAWAFGTTWQMGTITQERLEEIRHDIEGLDQLAKAESVDTDDEAWITARDAIVEKLEEVDTIVWPQIAHLRRLILSINRLMWQKVAATRAEKASRPAQKRAARNTAYKGDAVVRTVHLRREYDVLADLSDADRDELLAHDGRWWTHRWVVRGHPRNQWYPSLQDHRTIFIAPYVKGPADRPLKVKTNLFVVDR